MAPKVLLDTNVYIGYRYPQDEHHERAKKELDELPFEYSLTRSAALEVARLVRVKLGKIFSAILSTRSVRNPNVSSRTKLERIGKTLDKMEKEIRLGTMRRVVMDFIEQELEEGRTTLNLLPELIEESVSTIVPDINRFCGSKSLWNLPGSKTEGDADFIDECQLAVGNRAISGKRDEQIFYDVLSYSRSNPGVVFATYDWLFAKEAKESIESLVNAGILDRGSVTVVDLNKESIPR